MPLAVDLGSGSLVDLSRYGLPHEPTVAETLAHADLVTFSGDKLLGGPQAGIIVGREDLVTRLSRNPLMQALRADKLTLAALEATLDVYRNPDRLAERLPTLRLLTRPRADIAAAARRLQPAMTAAVGTAATVEVVACDSEVGSGALPIRTLPSARLALTPPGPKRARGAALERLAASFRALPVLWRRQAGTLIFDFHCLEDEGALVEQLDALTLD